MSKELNQEDITTATDEIRIRRAKKTYYFEDIINLSNVNELPNFIISSINCLKHCNIYLSISPSRGLLSHQYKRVKENIFIITDRNSKEDIIKELKRGNILNIKHDDVYNDILKSSTFYKSLLENDENGPLKKQNVSLTPGTIMRWDNLETISFKHSIKSRGNLPSFNSKKEIKVKKSVCCHQNNSKVTTYYTQSPKNRGMLLLINNIDFRDKERKRRGAIVDQENIVKLFTQLGFDIVEEKNKTKSEMEEIVKSFATNQNLEKYDMCVTIVMSHGGKINGETVIESINEENLSTKWIVEQFYGDNCKGMIDKPKIFIFQCCRNPIKTDVQKDSHRDSHLVPQNILYVE
nr:caspase-4-like [Onthophagus taurus]